MILRNNAPRPALLLDLPLPSHIVGELIICFGYSIAEIKTLHAKGISVEHMKTMAREANQQRH